MNQLTAMLGLLAALGGAPTLADSPAPDKTVDCVRDALHPPATTQRLVMVFAGG